VVTLRVDWAPLVVEDPVELILRLFILFTPRGEIHGADGIVWLALARGIPLVAGPSTVVVALPIVVVVRAWEVAALLLLFVSPTLHHVAYLHYRFGAVTPKVAVEKLDDNALWK